MFDLTLCYHMTVLQKKLTTNYHCTTLNTGFTGNIFPCVSRGALMVSNPVRVRTSFGVVHNGELKKTTS